MATDRSEDDPIWQAIREEVLREADRERLLSSFFYSTVLHHETLEATLSYLLADRLASATVSSLALREAVDEALAKEPAIAHAVRADLAAVVDRDPACSAYSVPLLYFKGFHALQTHRIAEWLWRDGRTALALHLQNRSSEVFAVDIHPAARIGAGIFMDHATSVVIGETAVVEDDVSMLHEVTLGGTGKEIGDRHPKIRRGVLVCAGAKVLGNVEVGEGATIAAGSVVLNDVPAHCTVAGVPAVVVGRSKSDKPALDMDSRLPGILEGNHGDGV